MRRRRYDDFVTGIADGTGLLVAFFIPIRLGFVWNIDRLSVVAPAGECDFYLDDISPANLVDVAAIASTNASDEASSIWVSGGRRLVAKFTGAGAAGVCTARAYGWLSR